MPLDIVRIGGVQYSWNSTITRVDGQIIKGPTEISWSEKLDVETVYSQTQDGVPIGDTAGQYQVDSFSMKMLWEYWEQLKFYLSFAAPGFPIGSRGLPGTYGRTKFIFQESASEPFEIGATPIQVDAAPCRVIGVKQTVAKGTGALEAELTLWCQQMRINGQSLYSPGLLSI